MLKKARYLMILFLMSILCGCAAKGSSYFMKEDSSAPEKKIKIKKEETIYLSLELADNTKIKGKSSRSELPVFVLPKKVMIPLEQVSIIQFDINRENAIINFQNGDKLSAILDVDDLEVETIFGKVKVGIDQIKKIIVNNRKDVPSEGLVAYYPFNGNANDESGNDGPNLEFYKRGNEVQGDREYVSGKFGDAVTLKGKYVSMARVHNLVLNNLTNIISPEKGCIELWYYQTEEPVAYSYGVYRFFDGYWGLGSGMGFQASKYSQIDSDRPVKIGFYLEFGGKMIEIWHPTSQIANNEWIHLAAVWDRNGINNSQNTMELFVNGEIVATTDEKDWGVTVGQRADICGGNDGDVSGKFKMDNLKIWNYAKTDFSDRFDE